MPITIPGPAGPVALAFPCDPQAVRADRAEARLDELWGLLAEARTIIETMGRNYVAVSAREALGYDDLCHRISMALDNYGS